MPPKSRALTRAQPSIQVCKAVGNRCANPLHFGDRESVSAATDCEPGNCALGHVLPVIGTGIIRHVSSVRRRCVLPRIFGSVKGQRVGHLVYYQPLSYWKASSSGQCDA